MYCENQKGVVQPAGGRPEVTDIKDSAPPAGTTPKTIKMMTLELQRNAPEGKALTGIITFKLGEETYFTNTLENTEYQIPEGKYWVTVNYSPKFKRLMPLICVKGRDGIRIHYGTKPEHSKGCVLVSDHKD